MTTAPSKPREFHGERESSWLIKWFNANQTDSPKMSSDEERSRKRVAELLSNLKRLSQVDALLDFQRRPVDPIWEERRRIVSGINDQLSRYVSHPSLLTNEPVLHEGRWQPIRLVDRDRQPNYIWGYTPVGKAPSDEVFAVGILEHAFKQGFMGNIRQCVVCNTWLFARKPGQETCSQKCSRKKHQSSPEYRAWRREHYRTGQKRQQSPKRRVR
jgi:hypothetical protein